MEFIVKEYEQYKEEEIINLYNSVGWINYVNNSTMLENSYKNSLKILGAYVDEKLVGVIRTVGDGYSIVYIQDILVLPEFQHKGIGKALLKQILELYQNAYQKVLLTDNTEKTIQFYQSNGFVMDTDVNCRAFLKML